jgi:ferredoxin
VNEVTSLDLGFVLAAFAHGATAVRLLLPARRQPAAAGVLRTLDHAAAALAGLGLDADPPRAAAIETDDPFTLGEALYALPRAPFAFAPARFLALGAPREIARQALRALREAAGAATEVVALPAQAPFGEARVDAAGCTLCLACTSACPTGAFSANPDTPQLRFQEESCVQCGLCVATCPERVIGLVPRLNFAAAAAQPRVVKAEPPAQCTRCAKPFGTRSSIERVKARLSASAHWMFADAARLAVLEMCDSCRILAATESGLDPYAGAPRPPTRTTEDYLREQERARRGTDPAPD